MMIPLVVVSFLGILRGSMIVLPQKGPIDLSGPSLSYQLFDAANSTVLSYSDSPAHAQSTVLYQSQVVCASKAVINRAESGTALLFYLGEQLVLDLSFPLAQYEPVRIEDLSQTGSISNVQVQSFSVSPIRFDKIVYARSPLPYIIL